MISVGALGVLSTMFGSSAPPTREVVAVTIGWLEPLVPSGPVTQPPVRLAGPKRSGPAGETPADEQNFAAEQKVSVDPSPASTVCVCVAAESRSSQCQFHRVSLK